MQGENSKDPLLSNKIAAAVLAALLLIFGLPQLVAALTGGGGHHGGEAEELHLAYCCVDLETEAAAPAEETADLATLLANANAAAGERRAALCRSCHTFGEGEPNSTGPNLWNVVGNPVANNSEFSYTGALENFGGEWTYDRLDAFIANSQEFIPGTAMVQRFPNPEQRADILAFLRTLSDDPVPFPEPQAGTLDDEPAPAEAAEEQSGNGREVLESADEIEAGDVGAAADTAEPQDDETEEGDAEPGETGEPE